MRLRCAAASLKSSLEQQAHFTTRIFLGRMALNGMWRSDCFHREPSAQVCIGSETSYPLVALGSLSQTENVSQALTCHIQCCLLVLGSIWDDTTSFPQHVISSFIASSCMHLNRVMSALLVIILGALFDFTFFILQKHVATAYEHNARLQYFWMWLLSYYLCDEHFHEHGMCNALQAGSELLERGPRSKLS